ncbi:RNA polymerase sigma factor SigZ [Shewanella sp. KX20019]|uniref:RNA polymerase sigma factor SigZ n=1 Tax=Shewanella sp. KX20019 TaxID=2803864 RepID=UPI001928D1E0|nr:RNA polymerase sigma factor SigZ [Shewanella sp. KX20019]QQX81141.1 RNA polymerase sigma factor SigZ [Shewanella sp. KX20019]
MDVEKIWSEYQASLKAFLHRNVSNPDDVDDLLQEVLIKTYNSLSSVHDSKKIKSWLFQIANNSIIDFYRQRAKGRDLTENDLWYNKPEEEVQQQLSSCIVPFISRLPEDDAAMLTAIEIDGMSQKEYAAIHDIKYSTLKSRVQKSRTQLHSLFDECCEFSIDKYGNVIDFQARNKSCSSC